MRPSGRGWIAYFVAEKRLSNEFAERTGCAPVTRLSWDGAGAGAATAVSVAGFKAGCAEACLVSAFAAEALEASLRGGLASATLGLAGAGCVALAVVSAAVPPKPILWARPEKKPSDGADWGWLSDDVAAATRTGEVEGASEAASGSSGEVTGPRGGLTFGGIVPGGLDSVSSASPWPPSDRPVLPLGSFAANTLCIPPSTPVFNRATGVPLSTSLANS